MRMVIYCVLSASLIVFVWWAYKQNHLTQNRQKTLAELQDRHGDSFYYLQYLKADWAHLSRAERLIALVENNFDRIELGPMTESNFVKLEAIPYSEDRRAKASLPLFQYVSEISSGSRLR